MPPLDEIEYHDMIDWQTLAVTKAPVTIYLTDNELKDMIPAQIPPSASSFASPVAHRRWKDAEAAVGGRDASP